MRLAKLTLNGFKSFADPTEFVFEDSLTGIVGPNGCGKSNVVDAIKWVLGERSSKSLRGKEMIDVIFAGSAGRKPAGMASVVLAFENPVLDEPPRDEGADPAAPIANGAAIALGGDDSLDDDLDGESTPSVIEAHIRGRRALPIDTDEVEVERRLYRDGTSQYLINGRRARLRDIRELFLDTGVGADAYSIIEQGKVDAMLLASPQERRTIFEEAAGIARYKQRRIESERKLQRADANLAVTREQLENTERRLRIVKGQAAKARRFQELESEFNAWRMSLAFEQYDDLRQRLDGLTSRLADLESTREAANRALGAAEHEKQEAELARADAMEQHRRLENEVTQVRHAIERAEQRRTMAERSVADLRAQRERDAQRHGELAERSTELDAAQAALTERVDALSSEVDEAQRRLDIASERRGQVLEQLASQQAAVSERRAAVTNIDRERAALGASIDSDQRRIDAVREQLERLDARKHSLSTEQRDHGAERDELRGAVTGRASEIERLEAEIETRDRQAGAMGDDRRERSERVASLDQRAVRLESRSQTLQELIEARAGLGDAVRDVLERKDRGDGFERVIAPLADLVETDEASAAAVEAGFGDALQALVVETVADLPGSEEIERLPGRVTFVPISRVGHPAARQVLDTRSLFGGGVASLRGLVKARHDTNGVNHERVEALLDRLLGDTFLVPDLDAALLLAGGPLAGRTLVTRTGAVLKPDGRIIAGPEGAAEGGGVLQQRGELNRLASELAVVRIDLDAARGELARVDEQAAALNDETAELRHTLAATQRALAGEQARLDRLDTEAERLDRELLAVDGELEQTSERLRALEADRVDLRDRSASLERLQAEEESAANEAQRLLDSVQSERDSIAETLSAARVDVSRINEQRSAARRELNRNELDRDELSRQVRDLARQIEGSGERSTEYEREIAEAELAVAEGRTAAERASGELTTAAALVAEREREVTGLGERVLEARRHAQHIDRDWHSLEVSRREIEVKRENLEERTGEELGMDLEGEYLEYRYLMLYAGAGGEEEAAPSRIDVDAAAAEIDLLRSEIKKLGHVNVDAIEEEHTLAGRNEELVRQVADIDRAREQLGALIERLNQVCRERFGEAFARIQAEFGGQQGMFRRLFGGGRAEVRLMPLIKTVETPDGPKKVETDEYDVLESGIEVIAKPPGKEPRSISQLSGGEKTMTAVALLLSIFRSKPSCFCVLDEVDAALDEANVGRYVDVVRHFTDTSDFIVITHNKRTMQSLDRLYGITQQERGVSTRVAVKLEREDHAEVTPPSAVEAAEETEGKPRNGTLRRALASLREESEATTPTG